MKLANNRVAFTKAFIDSIPYALDGKPVTYYDSNPTDLSLIVGKSTKSFYLQARVKNGEKAKIQIGKYGVLSINQAKEEVVKVKAKLQAGINPNLEKKQAKNNAILEEKKLAEEIEHKKKVAEFHAKKSVESIDWLLDQYRDEHIIKYKGGSESSIADIHYSKFYFKAQTITVLKHKEKKQGEKVNPNKEIEWVFDRNVDLPDLLNKPYREVSQREILERFQLFSKALPTNNAKVMKPMTRTYQKAFKNLGAAYSWILNKTQAITDEVITDELMVDNFIDNPVLVITRMKLWTKSKPRESYLDFFSYDAYLWWTTADEYRYEGMLARDYIFVSLLQGGRSIEVAPLKWSNIDMKNKIIKYVDTKNKQTYDMPMSKLVYEIFKRRFEEKTNDYVFAFAGSKHGYIVKSARWYFEEIAKKCGVKITHHDFRRTITNIAMQENSGIEKITLDHILKHKLKGTDANYFTKNKRIILNALQKIEDTILKQVEYYKVNGNPQ